MQRSNQIKLERQKFAKIIANLISRRKPLIYVDETTFNSWSIKDKSWSISKEQVLHARNNKRLSTTVYGAIGDCLKKPVFKLGQSTNSLEFMQFLLDVKRALRDEFTDTKPIFLYDAATAHTSHSS